MKTRQPIAKNDQKLINFTSTPYTNKGGHAAGNCSGGGGGSCNGCAACGGSCGCKV